MRILVLCYEYPPLGGGGGRVAQSIAIQMAARGHEVRVQSAELRTLKQPDLEWYFETAATSPENRRIVRDLIANAPASARAAFRLAEEDGKTVWWWPRLTLVARRD